MVRLMATKRGTTQFHGSLYEYYLDSRVGGANTWDNNRLGVANPSAHRNRFGGALGGPLTPSFWGGRTYFFANYEGLRYPFNTTIEREVPSALRRAGVIQVAGPSGVEAFNLNPAPVTVNGVTYQSAGAGAPGCGAAGTAMCDPRRSA